MIVYVLIHETLCYLDGFEFTSEVNVEGVFVNELDAKLALLDSKSGAYDSFYIEETELVG
ncbi:hypothetical protein JC777_00945 [Bacillus cytotoxicus]|uniref:Uncharacterized protein n=1 Tax=Bacillus cytotoxicus TaxID=580165 RepID=A0AAX2CKG0_9BACI|nr:hypothetical protein [Bacillus cytotoxicus]QTR83182.1 hypothetical protein JC777_00945 [Bacillus cytotoxicus]QTR86919.1 hypothetical protein JC774_20960 [Bacillus cytotoxicus]SCM00606.1 Uncharacterized protein BCB44BAC_03342 [Bacillus cytotoxicus]